MVMRKKIGPLTLGCLDDSIGNVPPEWSKYLGDGLSKLKDKRPGFPGQSWRYSNTNWDKVDDQEYGVAFKPKRIMRDPPPIDEIFANLDQWDFDCAMFVEVALLYAYQHSLPVSSESGFLRHID